MICCRTTIQLKKTEIVASPKASALKTSDKNQERNYIISGKVSCQGAFPLTLDSIQITIGSNDYVTFTDTSGYFKLILDSNYIKTYTIVTFSHPNLIREVRIIHKTSFPIELNILMRFPISGLMGVPTYNEEGNIEK